MFSEKEYIKAIGIISCYLNCDEMSTEEFNDSIVVINDLINEYFEIIEEKERLEKALDKACRLLDEMTEEDSLLCPSEYLGICHCMTTDNGYECCGDVDFGWKDAILEKVKQIDNGEEYDNR